MFVFLESGEVVVGYISELKDLKQFKKDRKREYFVFSLSTEKETQRTVCFSPDKYRLVSQVARENTGLEMTKFQRNDSNELILSTKSVIRKLAPDFDKQTEEMAKFTELETVINQSSLYEIVNVQGLLYELGDLQSVTKDGEMFQFVVG